MIPAINESVCTTGGQISGFSIFYLVIMGFLVVCNAVLLAGIGAHWRVLRHIIVYRYLISCLLSVICFCVVSTYGILHTHNHAYDGRIGGDVGLLQSYNQSDHIHRQIMRGWSYIKGLMVCLLLIMELNIAVLIYAVSDNTLFVGRYSDFSAANSQVPETKMRTKWPRLVIGKRGKAVLLTASAWLIPLVLSVPTASQWNCLENCICLPATRTAPTCISQDGKICSRLWLPTSQSFAIVMTLLYVTVIVFMFTMLVTVVRKFYKTYAPHSLGSKMEPRSINTEREAERRGSNGNNTRRNTSRHGSERLSELPVQYACSVQEIVEEAHVPESDTSNMGAGSEEIESTSAPRTARPPLHNTIKLLIALTFSIFFSVSPMMILYLYDVLDTSKPQPISGSAFDVTMAMTFIHAASQPIILLMYMLGLRKGCVNILLKLPCLRTTETVKQKPRFTADTAFPESVKSQKEMTPHAMTSLQNLGGEAAQNEPPLTASADTENFEDGAAKEFYSVEINSEKQPRADHEQLRPL